MRITVYVGSEKHHFDQVNQLHMISITGGSGIDTPIYPDGDDWKVKRELTVNVDLAAVVLVDTDRAELERAELPEVVDEGGE